MFEAIITIVVEQQRSLSGPIFGTKIEGDIVESENPSVEIFEYQLRVPVKRKQFSTRVKNGASVVVPVEYGIHIQVFF